jgi:hypothetical protein
MAAIKKFMCSNLLYLHISPVDGCKIVRLVLYSILPRKKK